MIESLEIILFAVLVVGRCWLLECETSSVLDADGHVRLVSAGLFTLMDAVDVAFTEALRVPVSQRSSFWRPSPSPT